MSAEPAITPRGRRLWGAALCVYAALALGDIGLHLFDDTRLGGHPAPARVAVSFAAGLFWPADVVAQLLAR